MKSVFLKVSIKLKFWIVFHTIKRVFPASEYIFLYVNSTLETVSLMVSKVALSGCIYTSTRLLCNYEYLGLKLYLLSGNMRAEIMESMF